MYRVSVFFVVRGYILSCLFGDEIFIIFLEQGLKFLQKISRKQLEKFLKSIRVQYWSSATELMVSLCALPVRHILLYISLYIFST